MKNNTFLIAKYAPDLSRMEPKNMGVILWSSGRAYAKFLPASQASFIDDVEVFESWVEYWSDLCSGKRTNIPKIGDVKVENPEFLEKLMTTQEGNYLLFCSGELIEKGRIANAIAATNHLYEKLVLHPERAAIKETRLELQVICKNVLTKSGISDHPDFVSSPTFEVQMMGIKQHLKLSYAVGGGPSKLAMQRVYLGSQDNINGSAWKMNCLRDLKELGRVALIRSSDIKNGSGEEGRDMLKKLCDVVDVDSPRKAALKLKKLAFAA